jgi:hypothetical protein
LNQLSIGLEDPVEKGAPRTDRAACKLETFTGSKDKGPGRAGEVRELGPGLYEFTPRIGTGPEVWRMIPG